MENDLSALNPSWYADMHSLEILHVERNHLQELPFRVFGALNNLRDLYVYQNNISMIDSESFGSLANLRTFYAPFNRINGIDADFFDNAVELSSLSLFGNVCNGDNFANVQNSRDEVRQVIEPCFDNFVAESGTLRCTFSPLGPVNLLCDLTIVNRFGREFDSIEGDLEGNETSVTDVVAFFQRAVNVPRILCSTFPNLQVMFFYFSDVQVLSADALEDCTNLVYFYSYYNPIEILPDNLFANSPNLVHATFLENEINRIEDDAFRGSALTTLSLDCECFYFFYFF